MSGTASEPRIIIVMLRQPDESNPEEARTDPLFEFGSFGLTGCHRRNLLASTRATGARLAFAQPGPKEVRLVMLTSPVTIVRHATVREATWAPPEMPLKFGDAPVLVDNDGNSDVPLLRATLQDGQRSTWVSQFASDFRSRTTPLDRDIAEELVSVWDQRVANKARARFYWEALAVRPPVQDRDRERTWADLLRSADPETLPPEPSPPSPSGGCRRPRRTC